MDVDFPPELLLLQHAASRREPAPHPGPELQRNYLAPLALDAASLAGAVGMDPERLERMLVGVEAIDVETAIRLARSLQINPRTLMERQLRHDFSIRRHDPELDKIPVLENDGRVTFPDFGYVSGMLSGLRDSWGWGEARSETLAFFADGHEGEHPSARMYAIKRGSRLRVYDPDGKVAWIGIVLETLEGKPLLPYVRPGDWIEWFVHRWRADFFPVR
jgi:addiction module HigA family antidote